jgi:hypothetical protein
LFDDRHARVRRHWCNGHDRPAIDDRTGRGEVGWIGDHGFIKDVTAVVPDAAPAVTV